jgi:hypothetical protein
VSTGGANYPVRKFFFLKGAWVETILFSNIVSFYAVETVSKYYNLPKNCLSDGTVSGLLLHFYEQQHITKPQYEAKKLEMMLAVKREQLVFSIIILRYTI